MTDPSGDPTVEGAPRNAAGAPSPPLTEREREELEADLKRLLEQREEYAYPGRLYVEGDTDDRARIREVLDRGIARTKRLLS